MKALNKDETRQKKTSLLLLDEGGPVSGVSQGNARFVLVLQADPKSFLVAIGITARVISRTVSSTLKEKKQEQVPGIHTQIK